MKQALLILIIFIIHSKPFFADDCGIPSSCPSNMQYPFIFCNTANDGKPEVHCTDNFEQFKEDNPHLVVRKAQLPICIGPLEALSPNL